ncbi:MAG: biotin--[acetyl-CoA-carboxylase] ligase [Sediminibacterium sp.]
MPRSAVKTTIGSQFTQLSIVDSTNIYAMKQLQANLAAHGSAFFALEQTAGKGQRGRKWQANPGENILLSVVLDSSFLVISQQFHLSLVVALATYDFLHRYIPDELSIKWPNDIYWRDRKTGGILLETSLLGNKWQWTIAGIGININQTHFPDLSKKAVSLKQITGKTHDPALLAKELCGCIDQRYRALKKEGFAPLLEAYRERLHKKGEWVRLKKNNTIGKYLIQSVSEQGDLVVEAGMEYVFAHGSVKWIG